MNTCRIDPCEKTAHNVGLCHMHYRRLKVHGTTDPQPHAPRPLAERFWEKVDKSGECWTWTGSTDRQGYGRVYLGSFDGVQRPPGLAYRVAWELAHGPIPDGLCVLHRCDNPPCVRVGHLFLGTKSDNTRDMDAKGRRNKANPVRGARHKLSKLTDDRVREARSRRASGETFESLAREFGVHPGTISHAVRQITWAHVS